MSPTRAYTWFAGVGSLLQGTVTLFTSIIPHMVPSHSVLHITAGLIGLATLRFGGSVGPRRYALWFGLFYMTLAIVGPLSGHPLGLNLIPGDHYLHAVLGGLGLLAVAVEYIRARAA